MSLDLRLSFEWNFSARNPSRTSNLQHKFNMQLRFSLFIYCINEVTWCPLAMEVTTLTWVFWDVKIIIKKKCKIKFLINLSVTQHHSCQVDNFWFKFSDVLLDVVGRYYEVYEGRSRKNFRIARETKDLWTVPFNRKKKKIYPLAVTKLWLMTTNK